MRAAPLAAPMANCHSRRGRDTLWSRPAETRQYIATGRAARASQEGAALPLPIIAPLLSTRYPGHKGAQERSPPLPAGPGLPDIRSRGGYELKRQCI